MFEIHRSRIYRLTMIYLMAGVSAVFASLSAASEDGVFLKTKSKPLYMKAKIQFEIKEGALDDGSEIEVLRSERKKGNYEVVGSVNYETGKKTFEFVDEKVQKNNYYYELRIKGRQVTSKPIRVKVLLFPPGT